MATSQRIMGESVTVIITKGGVVEAELVDITNFNLEIGIETKQQGFLGEKSDRTDMVYTVTKFDMETQLSNQQYFQFAQAIMDKATRKTPDVVFNITCVLEFPNGETPTVMLPDVAFGAIPVNISGRTDYAKSKIQGIASEWTPITS